MATTNIRSTCKEQEVALPTGIDGRAKVLVLDDDPALRELLGAMLDRLGCRAEICASSTQVIELFRSGGKDAAAFDCVLIDLNIGEEIDGVTVGRILREIDPRVRLVLISGSVSPRHLEAQISQGFDAVLPKPFSLRQLRETVLHHL
jgi:CheY-like chemotaxis protein